MVADAVILTDLLLSSATNRSCIERQNSILFKQGRRADEAVAGVVQARAGNQV